MTNWIALSEEGADVKRDANDVPVEWTPLRSGNNPLSPEERDGNSRISRAQRDAIP